MKMANDRIYLQCNICGKKLFLGKQFAWGSFYWENYGKLNGDENSPPLEDRLNEFFTEHHHPEADVCKWNGNYSIVYEIDNSGEFDSVWKPYEEVRHGRWKETTTLNLWECSVCGNMVYSETALDRKHFHKWCGKCGTRMVGEDELV